MTMVQCQSIESIYEEVLSGERTRFPRGTWQNFDNAVTVLNYLFKRKLKWSNEKILKKANAEFFGKYKLAGMVTALFPNGIGNQLKSYFPLEQQKSSRNSAPGGKIGKMTNFFLDKDVISIVGDINCIMNSQKLDLQASLTIVANKLGCDVKELRDTYYHTMRVHKVSQAHGRKARNAWTPELESMLKNGMEYTDAREKIMAKYSLTMRQYRLGIGARSKIDLDFLSLIEKAKKSKLNHHESLPVIPKSTMEKLKKLAVLSYRQGYLKNYTLTEMNRAVQYKYPKELIEHIYNAAI